ncbi:MAG: SUMF1/EgtB/PvdO family nonheme iron enzyme [Candidatus Thiodiazotropha sp.]
MKRISIFLTLLLSLGCENTTSGFETPEGPITPDGYRPPPPTKENIEKMVRDAIKNMVFVEGGTYMMGNFICLDGDLNENVKKYQIELIFCRTDEGPLHKVRLDSFSLNKYEISYYEYDLFTQATNRPWIQYDILNPKWWGQSSSYESAKRRFSKLRTGEMPAAIDWFQASDYCRWLGTVTGLPVELPTEAEWEFAARNRGQDFPYATDNGRIEPGRNYPSKAEDKRQPVKSFIPNLLGLYNMSFNVMEWVSDWYDENYYKQSPVDNPQGPQHGRGKVLRGGVAENKPSFNHNFGRVAKDIDYTHDKEILEMFNFSEGDALFKHGARCAIHLSEPIDINNLKIDLSKPAPDSRAEWLATKDGRTSSSN